MFFRSTTRQSSDITAGPACAWAVVERSTGRTEPFARRKSMPKSILRSCRLAGGGRFSPEGGCCNEWKSISAEFRCVDAGSEFFRCRANGGDSGGRWYWGLKSTDLCCIFEVQQFRASRSRVALDTRRKAGLPLVAHVQPSWQGRYRAGQTQKSGFAREVSWSCACRVCSNVCRASSTQGWWPELHKLRQMGGRTNVGTPFRRH